MTILVSFTLAILLFSFFLESDSTPPIIYVTEGLLIAMGIWHIQTLLRSLQLRKHFKNQNARRESAAAANEPLPGESASTGKLLEQADFSDVVPPSVTDSTTKHLDVNSEGETMTLPKL